MADTYLYERVYDFLLGEIRNGSLAAGDRVPSEKELADRFDVSRITSKRALTMLEEGGLVYRRRGKGSFVVDDIPPLDTVGRPAREGRAGGEVGRPRVLGLVMPDPSESYGLELLCAVEERAAELGYHLILRRTRDRQDAEERAIEGMVAGQGLVAGLVVFPVHGEFYNPSLVRLVLEHYPLVLVDRYLPGMAACAVHTDNVAAAQALTENLLERGHGQVAFLSPPAEHTTSIEERLQGFTSVVTDRGLAARHFSDIRSTLPGFGTDDERRNDRRALRSFLLAHPEITGFVACEYDLAVLLWQVLRELDDRPLDGATIACFDSPDRAFAGPRFVHIRQDQAEMGRRAVDLLVAQLAGESVPSQSLVPFELRDKQVTNDLFNDVTSR